MQNKQNDEEFSKLQYYLEIILIQINSRIVIISFVNLFKRLIDF